MTTSKANNNNNNSVAFTVPTHLSTAEALRIIHAFAGSAYTIFANRWWAESMATARVACRAKTGLPFVTSSTYSNGVVDTAIAVIPVPAVDLSVGTDLVKLLRNYSAALNLITPFASYPSSTLSVEITGRDAVIDQIASLFVSSAVPDVDVVHVTLDVDVEYSSDIQLRVAQQLAVASKIFNCAAVSWYLQQSLNSLRRAAAITSQTLTIPDELFAMCKRFELLITESTEKFVTLGNALRDIKIRLVQFEQARAGVPKEKKPTVKPGVSLSSADLEDIERILGL